jgi:hypothetical protein
VLPVLQELLDKEPNDNDPPPDNFAAKLEIFLRTCLPPQVGQTISFAGIPLRTNSSNGLPQSLHSNSNNGIPVNLRFYKFPID